MSTFTPTTSFIHTFFDFSTIAHCRAGEAVPIDTRRFSECTGCFLGTTDTHTSDGNASNPAHTYTG